MLGSLFAPRKKLAKHIQIPYSTVLYMTALSLLSTQAVSAASNGRWEEAREANEKILEIEPADIGALNRLGFCFLQLGDTRQAKEQYEKVLSIERFNPIAAKYLGLMKKKIKPQVESVRLTGDFIEEPGKTKSVSLVKLTEPDVLQSLPTAAPCELIVRNHRVDVVSTKNRQYIGCLPDDIAFRLQKMIASGTTYQVSIQSTSKKGCIVFIKEKTHSPTSPFATSFPLSGSLRSAHQEDILLDEDPLDIRETGDDGETSETEEPDSTE